MQRIYFSEIKSTDKVLIIKNKEIIHQLIKVLRSKKGDYITFFNGIDDNDYLCVIDEIEKKEIFFSVLEVLENKNEIDFTLNLYQAFPNKLEKIEYILQKGVEIGYTNFFFYKSERSQNLFLSSNKLERMKKIIIEAVEQSGRNKIPELNISDEISFVKLKNDENIYFHTDFLDSTNIKNLEINYTKKINVFVGPEGGFSTKEISQFEENNFKKVFLGNRILRTETTSSVTGFYIIQTKN